MHSTKNSLTKADILRGRMTYDHLLREGRRVRGRGVTLFFTFVPTTFRDDRTLRPFGGAIKRNYARRRLREYFRLNRDLFPDGHDTLVRLFRAPDDWDHFFSQLDELLSEARRMAKSTSGS